MGLAAGVCRFIPACAGNSNVVVPRGDYCDGSSPRVRGTRIRRSRCRPGTGGSSPRVRGTPVGRATAPRDTPVHPRVCGELAAGAGAGGSNRRFIPACAGNSSAGWRGRSACPVHPRVCGELAHTANLRGNLNGSSPRVRGTRPAPCRARRRATVHPRVCGELARAVEQPGLRLRFIPACAGNSIWVTRTRVTTPVHPRVCGELRDVPLAGVARLGSSPRVRGTPVGAVGQLVGGRFIPACAGNSASTPANRGRTPVHPRVCGELYSSARPWRGFPGSSPRVRGTLRPRRSSMMAGRFIPACAGNSSPVQRSQTPTAVHPRVCGELPCRTRSRIVAGGSSPRVRGTRCRRAAARRAARFIPACAGNSLALALWPDGHRGSSPRVRGTRPSDVVGGRAGRFIPACAGNSTHPCFSICAICGSSPRVRGTRINPPQPA